MQAGSTVCDGRPNNAPFSSRSYLQFNVIPLSAFKSLEYCRKTTGSLCLHGVAAPKVSTVPAVTETDDYSGSESGNCWPRSASSHRCTPQERASLFRVSYFSADVCNYSADLSNGSEGDSSHDAPLPLPPFPQKPQPSSDPSPLLLGSHDCLEICLFTSVCGSV